MTHDVQREAGEEDELPPPTARRVATRAGVLVALAYRALLEGETARASEAREAHERLLAWIRTPDVAGELEPAEREAIECPVGGLTRRRTVDDSWASEPAAVLSWALGLFELPHYEEQVSGADVASSIDFLEDPWLLPAGAVLRPETELLAGWASALTVHWRLREQVHNPGPVDFPDYVARCEWAPLTLDGLALRDRDLVVRGRLVTEAETDVVHECLEIARERHKAFEWLTGGDTSLWSEVTTDT
jgi:hypothetical protein